MAGSGVTKAEKPPASRVGGLALQGLVARPTVTLPSERSSRLSPYHQSGKVNNFPAAPLLGVALLTAL